MTALGGNWSSSGRVVLLVCLIAIFSDFFSTQNPEEQDLTRFFCPPTRVHFIDRGSGSFALPFVYNYAISDPLQVTYAEETTVGHPLRYFARGYGYRLLGIIPASRHLIVCPGGAFHPLGTDELGRDVLARTLAGTRTSLLVVLMGTALCVAFGSIVGLAAGFSGGWIDTLLMRFSEFVFALPALYIILALRAILPSKLPLWQTLLMIVGTIAAIAWPPVARNIRGLVMQIRHTGFVEAARALGSSQWQITWRHIIPALGHALVSQMVLVAPVFLLGEIVLSFLDVGLHDGGASWGAMLRNLKDPRVLTDFWWNLLPLVMVILTLYLMNRLGARAAWEGRGRRSAII